MYCDANSNKDHLTTLINWLYNEVSSAGGDGDAMWYSKYYNVADLFPIIQEYNKSLRFPWNHLELNDGCIHWDDNQESIFITNRKEDFDNRPSWQQVSIVY